MILEKINSPADVRSLSTDELPLLAEEIRKNILNTVSVNGGHLASNLCVVELTIALHRVFDSPNDKIVFDVGHQCYAHKLLTGRREEFSTLRTLDGISGFPVRSESEHDAFGAGHSSTSISAAAGIAAANQLCGKENYTIAVVGDGAFTGGMIYEALNNCSEKERLIIVLNDNDMSISPNVGGMSRYFSKVRSSAKYFDFKHKTKSFFAGTPLIGNGLIKCARSVKNTFKKVVLSQNFFEQFGLGYYGPLNGNDERHIETVLREAKDEKKCCVIHICTKKGMGYAPAEERPDIFHGVSGFDIDSGEIKTGSSDSFSDKFGELVCEHAEKNDRIVAITAAMADGTGLSKFSKLYPDRFFDVGIAEEHALTFASGMASEGIIPIFAVYSTFAQRAFDQLIHDASLQKLHVILALDRAGLVANDGSTHHGIFDTAFVSEIPNVMFLAPNDFDSLSDAMDKAVTASGPVVIRYPKGNDYDMSEFNRKDGYDVRTFGSEPKSAIITYGRLTADAVVAAEKCDGVKVISIKTLSPLPVDEIESELMGIDRIVFAEEGIKNGGIGQRLCATLTERNALVGKNFSIRAIDGIFPKHGKNSELLERLGLSADALAGAINEGGR